MKRPGFFFGPFSAIILIASLSFLNTRGYGEFPIGDLGHRTLDSRRPRPRTEIARPEDALPNVLDLLRGFLACDLGKLAKDLLKAVLPDGQVPEPVKRALFQALAHNPRTRNYLLGETEEQKQRNLRRFYGSIEGRNDFEKANTLLQIAEITARFERKNQSAAHRLFTSALLDDNHGNNRGYLFHVPTPLKYQTKELLWYVEHSPIVREILGDDERLGVDDIYPTLRGFVIALCVYMQHNNGLPNLPGMRNPERDINPLLLSLAQALGIFAQIGEGLCHNDHHGRGLLGDMVADANRMVDKIALQAGEQLAKGAGLYGEVSLSSAAPRHFSLAEIRDAVLDLHRFEGVVDTTAFRPPSSLPDFYLESPPQFRFGYGIPVYDLVHSAQDFLDGNYPREIRSIRAMPGQDRIVIQFQSGSEAIIEL